MIHVSPCSCELHQALREALERNRELEAELAEARFRTFGEGVLLSVHEHATLLARAEKAEARVAELERAEEFWHNLAALNVRPDLIEHYLKNPRLLLPPDMVGDETPSQGVQEREAD